MKHPIKIVMIGTWLLAAGLVMVSLPAATAVAADEESAPSDAEAKKASERCEGQFRRCMNGESMGESNPYVDTSCDVARDTGRLDPQTWEKCRDWCESQRQQCRDKASD